MTICRFSSDNCYSDVYVYQSDDGWVTHVATRRWPPGAPPEARVADLVDGTAEGRQRYLAAYKNHRKWRMKVVMLPIEHPDAGKMYVHPTPGESAALLARLSEQGLHVPAGAIDRLLAIDEKDG